MAEEGIWQASEARTRLPMLMAAALAGKPQIIREDSGAEVVMVSRADYDRMKPTLKDFLLQSAGAAGDDDDEAFTEALRQVRALGSPGLVPRGDIIGE
jgi:prevent-host-death family protein